VQRIVMLGAIFAAGAASFYWHYLKFRSGRGVFYYLSPEYGGYVLFGTSVIVCGGVVFIAWREISSRD
jgi:hypothetical protein